MDKLIVKRSSCDLIEGGGTFDFSRVWGCTILRGGGCVLHHLVGSAHLHSISKGGNTWIKTPQLSGRQSTLSFHASITSLK